MDRNAPNFDRYLLVSNTNRAKRRVDDALELAERLVNDTDKAARLERHLCKACHYFSRMAGAACTTQPCACCASPEQYGSTAPDVLCHPCAKEHSLCKHCGGDLEMRVGRRKWPTDTPAPAGDATA
jgi:ribosomal protein L32